MVQFIYRKELFSQLFLGDFFRERWIIHIHVFSNTIKNEICWIWICTLLFLFDKVGRSRNYDECECHSEYILGTWDWVVRIDPIKAVIIEIYVHNACTMYYEPSVRGFYSLYNPRVWISAFVLNWTYTTNGFAQPHSYVWIT